MKAATSLTPVPGPSRCHRSSSRNSEVLAVIRFLIVPIVATAWMTCAFAESGPFQFNGLSWGSTIAQIKARFPGKTKPWCVDPKDPYYPCGKLIVEPYEVAGIPFQLLLEVGMGSTGEAIELSGIQLSYSDDYAKHTASEDAWSVSCGRLATALTARYGSAVSDRAGSFDYRSRYAEWRLPDTEITLLCSWHANDRDLRTLPPYSARYRVVYKRTQPPMNDDARRL